MPLDSDMVFDVDILDFNVAPNHKDPEVQPRTTTMQPNQCFYLHLKSTEHTAYDFVLSTEQDDYSKSWPAKYAIIEHRVIDEASQQWFYDESDGSIRNAADPTYFLDHDMGWAMVADVSKAKAVGKHFPTQKRKWFYDDETSELTTEINGVHSALATLGQPRQWESVQLAPANSVETSESAKWRIEYCYTGK